MPGSLTIDYAWELNKTNVSHKLIGLLRSKTVLT